MVGIGSPDGTHSTDTRCGASVCARGVERQGSRALRLRCAPRDGPYLAGRSPRPVGCVGLCRWGRTRSRADASSVAAGLPLPVEWLTMQAPSWGTLMLPACLRGRTGAATALSKAAGATIPSWEPWLAPETPGDFDGSLRAVLTPGTFTWVEPTLCRSSRSMRWRWAKTPGWQRAACPCRPPGLRRGLECGKPERARRRPPSYAYLTGLVLLGLPRDHPCVGPAVTFLSSDALRPSTLSLGVDTRAPAAWTGCGGAGDGVAGTGVRDGSFDGR